MMSKLTDELRHHEREYPSLVHGPLCGNAADIIEELMRALEPTKAEHNARERLMNNGRNQANKNQGIRTGSDLHLCEMLLKQFDDARAALAKVQS